VEILRGSDTLRTVFSRRSSRDRSLNVIARRLAQGDVPRWDLTSANPTTAGIEYPEALLGVLVRAQTESLVYRPEPFGELPARQRVGRLACADPRDIMLTASTSEAYSFLFKLLCDAGDAVLVPAPSYPLFEHLAELEGVRAVPYRLAYDGAWHVDLDSVRRAAAPSVRAVVIVSPNNPTGHYSSRAERAALAELGLPIISDEVFSAFALDGSSPAREADDACLTFTLDGLSKRAGLPQLKLAWTVVSGPEAARRQARERLELIADTFLSVGTPIQRALPELLDHGPTISGRIGQRCRENLRALRAMTADSPVTLLRAEGGWSAVLHLPRLASEEEIVLGLIERGVLVQPGWFYDFESEPYVVVSLLVEPSTFREGGQRLVEHVTALAG
jgi:alanine-synthesizing transaminase